MRKLPRRRQRMGLVGAFSLVCLCQWLRSACVRTSWLSAKASTFSAAAGTQLGAWNMLPRGPSQRTYGPCTVFLQATQVTALPDLSRKSLASLSLGITDSYEIRSTDTTHAHTRTHARAHILSHSIIQFAAIPRPLPYNSEIAPSFT